MLIYCNSCFIYELLYSIPATHADSSTSHNGNNKSIDNNVNTTSSSSYMHLDNDSNIFDIKPNTNVSRDHFRVILD